MDNIFHVSFPGMGIENITINRVAFSFFGIEVYWYGMLISIAVVLGLFILHRMAGRFGINPDIVLDTVILLVPVMIVAARLYYVVFSFDEFKGNIWSVFNLRSGGLAFYGGVIGGVLAVFIISKVKKVSFSRLADLFVVVLPLSQGIGRWGNFFNQEAFGSGTTLPWGMVSEGTKSYLTQLGHVNPSTPVHPTFLYEFIANIIIFVILYFVHEKSKRPFETLMVYLMSYGLVRFFVESIRTDSLYIGNTQIRVSMLLSGTMVAFGLVCFIIIRRKPILTNAAGIVQPTQEGAESTIKSNFDTIEDNNIVNTSTENTSTEDTSAEFSITEEKTTEEKTNQEKTNQEKTTEDNTTEDNPSEKNQ